MSDEKRYTEREVIVRERAAIDEAAEWIFREARAAGRKGDGGIEGVDARTLADILRPLPTVTRPRVVADPHGAGRWGAKPACGTLAVHLVSSDEEWYASEWAQIATPQRVALWADLLANPTEEVDA